MLKESNEIEAINARGDGTDPRPWGRGVMLIAVTGWGQEEDRRRALEAGCDHHLTKPVAPETVESLLQSLDPAFRSAK